MRINYNISAVVANKQLLRTENNLKSTMERLSSGLKLNHAKDNPAGMAISNKMREQIAGLDRASSNASDGISAIQIADGALNETASLLQRMRELAVQAANDTNTESEREAIQQEIEQLKKEVNRVSTDTEYNQMPLLDGSQGTRCYADTNQISRIQVSDGVPAGLYKFKVAAEAEPAASHTICSGSLDPLDNATIPGYWGTVTINGVSTEIKNTDTEAQIYTKLHEAADRAGCGMSDDRAGFWTKEEGDMAALTLTFSDSALANALGYASGDLFIDPETNEATVYTNMTFDPSGALVPMIPIRGENMQVEATKESVDPTSRFSDTVSYTTKGNRLTFSDANGFKMSMLVADGFTGDVEIQVTEMGTMTMQIGANKSQSMEIDIPEVSCKSLYIDDLEVTTRENASKAITSIDEAIASLSEVRSRIGAYQNRLDYAVASLDEFSENITSALSRLADADMAKEMTDYTQHNVLDQAAISVLTQANDLPQQVLQILQ